MKKPAGRFGFGFITKKPKKPNRTETNKKPEKTEPNRAKTGKTEKTEPKLEKPSQTGLNRFYLKKPNRNRSVWLGFGFFFQKKNSVWLLFLIKTEPNRTENDHPWLLIKWGRLYIVVDRFQEMSISAIYVHIA